MRFQLAAEVGVVTKLCKSVLGLNTAGLNLGLLFFPLLFCYILDYLTAYLGVPCLVIYTQYKHFE